MMRVLLTGAAGFIGAHVTRLALEGGHDVLALVRPGGNLARIQDLLPRITVLAADLTDPKQLGEVAIRLQTDLCVHLAWDTTPGQYLTSERNLDLLTGSCRLGQLLAGQGCHRFVGIGTCFEYDTDYGYLSETTPTGPRTLYAAAKLAVALVLERLAAISGMQLGWVRLFYQYGPHEHPLRLVPTVVRALLRGQPAEVGHGQQIRDYLHVHDVARAIWSVALSDATGPVNVGSGRPVTVRRIIQIIARQLHGEHLVRWGARPASLEDPTFLCANNGLLVERTGWAPDYGLEDGLAQTISWWQEAQA